MIRDTVPGYSEKLLHFPVTKIVQMQCSNAVNWNLFQFHFERHGAFTELNSGNWWRNAEEKMKELCSAGLCLCSISNQVEETLLFPQIVYADAAIVYTSCNKAVHPVYLIPAALPLHERLKQQNRYLWAYLPKEVPLWECLEILGMV